MLLAPQGEKIERICIARSRRRRSCAAPRRRSTRAAAGRLSARRSPRWSKRSLHRLAPGLGRSPRDRPHRVIARAHHARRAGQHLVARRQHEDRHRVEPRRADLSRALRRCRGGGPPTASAASASAPVPPRAEHVRPLGEPAATSSARRHPRHEVYSRPLSSPARRDRVVYETENEARHFSGELDAQRVLFPDRGGQMTNTIPLRPGFASHSRFLDLLPDLLRLAPRASSAPPAHLGLGATCSAIVLVSRWISWSRNSRRLPDRLAVRRPRRSASAPARRCRGTLRSTSGDDPARSAGSAASCAKPREESSAITWHGRAAATRSVELALQGDPGITRPARPRTSRAPISRLRARHSRDDEVVLGAAQPSFRRSSGQARPAPRSTAPSITLDRARRQVLERVPRAVRGEHARHAQRRVQGSSAARITGRTRHAAPCPPR